MTENASIKVGLRAILTRQSIVASTLSISLLISLGLYLVGFLKEEGLETTDFELSTSPELSFKTLFGRFVFLSERNSLKTGPVNSPNISNEGPSVS